MTDPATCPVCAADMRSHRTAGPESWACAGCGAVWAPKGVLSTLLGTDEDLRSTFAESAPTDRHCPMDGTALGRVPYARLDPSVTLDRCPTCEGLLIEAAQIPQLEALNERIRTLFGDGTFSRRGNRRPARLRRLLVRLLSG